mgnify:CR=1 FL=1
MGTFIEIMNNYLEHSFVRYAIIVGLLIAICSSLIGVTLVLKRFSFIGDGLSHVAFGAMAIGTVLNLADNMLLTLPITIISAVVLLKSGQNAKIKGDAAIAMLSVSALAFGYLLLNIFSASSNVSGDVCTTLFGSTSILTLTERDVIICIILSVLIISSFIFLYHSIFDVTFDEDFAKAVGTKTDLYNLIIAIIIAVIIVLGMRLVGALLISALIIFPALSAMSIYKTFLSVTICSLVVSFVGAFIGLIFSIYVGTPVGATIVGSDAIIFAGFSITGKVLGR